MPTPAVKRPTGRLRFVKGRLQQEFVIAPAITVHAYLNDPSIELIASQVELSWEDVPSEEDESVPNVPG